MKKPSFQPELPPSFPHLRPQALNKGSRKWRGWGPCSDPASQHHRARWVSQPGLWEAGFDCFHGQSEGSLGELGGHFSICVVCVNLGWHVNVKLKIILKGWQFSFHQNWQVRPLRLPSLCLHVSECNEPHLEPIKASVTI